MTVQTGLITAVWAIVDLGVFLGDVSFCLFPRSFPVLTLYIAHGITPHLQFPSFKAVQQLIAI